MMSKSIKVRHDVKMYVKMYVMTSTDMVSTLSRQNICHPVRMCHDFKKYVIMLKVRHDVSKYDMTSKSMEIMS